MSLDLSGWDSDGATLRPSLESKDHPEASGGAGLDMLPKVLPLA